MLVERTKIASRVLSRRRATPLFRALRLRKETVKCKQRERQVYLQTHKEIQDTAYTFLKNKENTEKQQQNAYAHVRARSLSARDSCFHVHRGQSIYTRKLGVYEKYTPCSLQSDWMIQSYRSLNIYIYIYQDSLLPIRKIDKICGRKQKEALLLPSTVFANPCTCTCQTSFIWVGVMVRVNFHHYSVKLAF